eukprot:TRINITY_DN5199_c0_g1_i1.p1 TRINITY_DN5199_c0_g1~~TRINITY_DN5199_c0_g1_i1.p1  ORF type:complete len:149 (-),score=30.35 TRINITY_DN5199_c0_g1_i1:41-487(-)
MLVTGMVNNDSETTKPSTSGQRVGISSQFLNSVGIQYQETNNELKFKLTSEIIHLIFVKYPAIAKELSQKVPLEMTEEEFWVEVLQKDYIKNLLFPKQKGANNNNNNNNNNSKRKKTKTEVKNENLEQEAKKEDPSEVKKRFDDRSYG